MIILATHWRKLLVVVLLVVALLIPHFLQLFWLSTVIQILIFGLFALSHDLLIGQTGMVPLGHTVFFAVAAYTVAILQVDYNQSFIVASLSGLVAAIVFAVLLGFSIRTTGVYFILLTLSLGIIIWGVAHRWSSFTGGDNGIVGVTPPVIAGVDFAVLTNYYYVVLVVTALCMLVYHVIIRSPFGLTLRGIRESESRMHSLGYWVTVHKFVAFVLSGTLAGVAGILYVYWNKFVSPAAAEFLRGAEAVLMVIIGGSGSLFGPFLGATIITFIRNQLSAETERFLTIMGVVFILTALYAPGGLIGVAKGLYQKIQRSRSEVAMRPRQEHG